jgi:hypothetical protein
VPRLVTATFPIVQTPAGVPTAQPVAFPRAPMFDFELGDFVVDAAGRLVIADGYTAWQQWCQKALMTQMAAYAIYPRMHGMDISVIFKNRPRPVIESDLTHRIRYALTRTVRTVDVIEFTFDWTQAYIVSLECTPIPAAGAPFRLPGQFPPKGSQ